VLGPHDLHAFGGQAPELLQLAFVELQPRDSLELTHSSRLQCPLTDGHRPRAVDGQPMLRSVRLSCCGLMRLLQGCTHEPWPRSSRMDCITWNVVLSVKTSAAASRPVYFSITGAAAVAAISSRPPLSAAQTLSPYFSK